uniref:Uncharacterized protein n=1 Tax=Tetranychus urticae TaxID=32264 RepID=T1KGQ7_TETUR
MLILTIVSVESEKEQSNGFSLRQLFERQVSRLQRLAPSTNQQSEMNEQSERSIYSSSRLMESVNKGIAANYKKFKGAGSWID